MMFPFNLLQAIPAQYYRSNSLRHILRVSAPVVPIITPHRKSVTRRCNRRCLQNSAIGLNTCLIKCSRSACMSWMKTNVEIWGGKGRPDSECGGDENSDQPPVLTTAWPLRQGLSRRTSRNSFDHVQPRACNPHRLNIKVEIERAIFSPILELSYTSPSIRCRNRASSIFSMLKSSDASPIEDMMALISLSKYPISPERQEKWGVWKILLFQKESHYFGGSPT